MGSAYDDHPVQELGPITDLFAEDIDRIEVLGENVRMVFWRWKSDEGAWRRVALEWAMIVPLKSFRLPADRWPNVKVIKPPGSNVLFVLYPLTPKTLYLVSHAAKALSSTGRVALRASARMFRAAFTSRSWLSPHDEHSHALIRKPF